MYTKDDLGLRNWTIFGQNQNFRQDLSGWLQKQC